MRTQNLELEIKPFYNTNGTLNREQTLIINTWELVKTPKCKPPKKVIQELKYIKKIRRESKFYPIDDKKEWCLEYTIGTLANQKKRRKFREQQIQEIISLLQKIQKDRHIISMSRNFIVSILKDFSNLSERVRSSIVSEIIKRGKEREIIKTEKRLKDIPHYERKFKGERTTSRNNGIDREWVLINRYIKTYSFNN